ncbi:hypothetical protein OROHE_010756 [Orobanche hederae]
MTKVRDTINWVERGAVPPVFDQGETSSCVAVSVAQCVVSLLKIQNPDEEFAELSFQYIYDFAYRPGKYRNHDTLRPDDVFGLLMDCGICLESVLPFRGCRTKFHRLGIQDRVRDSYSKGLMVKLDGYGFVQGDTPSEILPAVARQLKNGPLIGTIKTNERFMSHEGEVISN